MRVSATTATAASAAAAVVAGRVPLVFGVEMAAATCDGADGAALAGVVAVAAAGAPAHGTAWASNFA